MGCFKMKLI